MPANSMPTDFQGNVTSAGTVNNSFWVTPTTATGWNAVPLPAGIESKNCLIQVHSGDITAELVSDPVKFGFSSNADGSGWAIFSGGMSPGIGKDAGILGYVYTGSTSAKIAVLVLA